MTAAPTAMTIQSLQIKIQSLGNVFLPIFGSLILL
jgi:hypothetical protein